MRRTLLKSQREQGVALGLKTTNQDQRDIHHTLSS
ncbi:hypothetical protein M3J09_004749 [Ascochyta lentis]